MNAKAKVKVKALALLSGGLDSILALKLILAQGIDRDIEVVAVNFVLPFISEKRNYAAGFDPTDNPRMHPPDVAFVADVYAWKHDGLYP